MLKWKSIPPLVRIPFLYGLLGGVLCLGLVIALYYGKKHPLLIPPFFDIRVFVSAILIYFALREVRDYFFEGILFFWQGLGGCLAFFASLSLVTVPGIYFFGKKVDGFVTLYVEQGLEQLKSYSPDTIKQFGQVQYNTLLSTFPSTTIEILTQQYLKQTLIIAIFLSIVLSIILRRQPKPL